MVWKPSLNSSQSKLSKTESASTTFQAVLKKSRKVKGLGRAVDQSVHPTGQWCERGNSMFVPQEKMKRVSSVRVVGYIQSKICCASWKIPASQVWNLYEPCPIPRRALILKGSVFVFFFIELLLKFLASCGCKWCINALSIPQILHNMSCRIITHMEVSWNRATLSHHPLLDGIFHEINHPVGYPPLMETPIWSVRLFENAPVEVVWCQDLPQRNTSGQQYCDHGISVIALAWARPGKKHETEANVKWNPIFW